MQRSIPPNKGMNKHGYICLYMLNDMHIFVLYFQLMLIYMFLSKLDYLFDVFVWN